MNAIELINEIAPKHGRTSCDDEQSNGNEYFNEFGAPRCGRCALLSRLKQGKWPHDATPHVAVQFTGHTSIIEDPFEAILKQIEG